MKKTIISLALLLTLGIPTVGTLSSCAKQHASKPMTETKTVSAVCPVMGTKIPDITKAAGKSVYKGKTYYFCCPGCKPTFDKNPAKYAK